MIKAVLLDLDNTLLFNPDSVFARELLELADTFFSAALKIPSISGAMLAATKAMNSIRQDFLGNIELATEVIEASTGVDKNQLEHAFRSFYSSVYPQLYDCVQPTGNSASTLIEALLNHNVAIGIATNPIYPAEAVWERLRWAQLSPYFSEFALVTHNENMHFAKPDPAYYVEIVARIGVEPDEALMIGDSFENDIAPARQAGLHVHKIPTPQDPDELSHSLNETREKLKNEGWLESFNPQPITSLMVEHELRGNMGALLGTMHDIQPSFWNQHPDPNEWSPIQIICHLLETEVTVQRGRLERIRAEENPFLIAPPPPAGPKNFLPCDNDGFAATKRLLNVRLETLEWLKTLTDEEWSRPARHSIFGPTNLLEMAHFTAQHDRLHINQLCQTLGRCK